MDLDPFQMVDLDLDLDLNPNFQKDRIRIPNPKKLDSSIPWFLSKVSECVADSEDVSSVEDYTESIMAGVKITQVEQPRDFAFRSVLSTCSTREIQTFLFCLESNHLLYSKPLML